MSPRGRLVSFAVAACVVGLVFVAALFQAPASGTFSGAYGQLLDHVAPVERHATDVTTAINFDYRAVDTLGEEFILFASVAGVVLLLRLHPGESEPKGSAHDEGERLARPVPRTSNAVRLLGLGLVGFGVVFGLYVVTHGQISPGGGFQGGVVLATAPVLAYLAGGADVFERIAPERIVQAGEAVGAALFVALGFVGVLAGGAFLQNVLPLGRGGSISGGGTIACLDLATGIEVAGGFVVVLTAFLSELLKVERAARDRGRSP